MSILSTQIEYELSLFWKWAGISEKQYSEHSWSNEYEEWEYPNWDTLICLFFTAVSALASGNCSELLVNYLLTGMALDNEGETILDECEAKLSDKDIEFLFEIGVKHLPSEARWQVAELIGRKDDKSFKKYLQDLLDDSNKYVQRRALLSLSRLDAEEAQEIAFKRLKDEDDYIRLVSIRILKEHNSQKLKEAVLILVNDKFEYVQDELKEIAILDL
ncbi:MAG TPA: HEAT repeat domain-containing protein [Pseudobacteroides sp.]|uniref:HEAT repeat domain-containing protein n=1 Tax=Pseudobacteroides sp. TaxID=1968840 RepID=UPI002F9563B7